MEVQTAVYVWYYSTGGALCLSTEFAGKGARQVLLCMCLSGYQAAFRDG
jgi:hypothetical protein